MPLTLDAGFPGGNIVVERVEGDDLYLHQDLRDTTQDWFYWCFRVRGAADRALTFHFTASRALGVRGPAVSRDGGRTWAWLGTEALVGDDYRGFSYRFGSDEDDMRFSYGMPYLQEHWQRFAEALPESPLFSQGVLCRSNKGRDVERLTIGDPEAAEHAVAITARHHCCEMIADHVIEGLVDRVLNGQDAVASWLREQVAFFIVPFVDKDGVEEGDQGKARDPWDHGRDYRDDGRYAEPRAIKEQLPAWGGERLHLCLDLHCPHIAGEYNELIYLVGHQNPTIAREQDRFVAILEAQQKGPLPFEADGLLPFGTAWNQASNYEGGVSFARWAATLPGVRLATTIEVPYASVKGVAVTAEAARAFGRDLAAAIVAYLEA